MKFQYRVEVELDNGRRRIWLEEGNDSNKILKNICTVLDRCAVDYKRVEVSLGS